MIITIANQKGGVGKSTLTTLLAISLKDKYKLAIIDTDPQASLHNNINGLNDLKVFKHDLSTFTKDMDSYKDYELLLVDTLPSTDINIVKLFSKSDLVVIPTGASLLDVTASMNTIDILNSIKMPFKIIFNNIKNIKDLEEIKAYFEKENIPIAKNYLYSRVAYSRIFKTNLIIDDAKAKEELDNLLKELL